MFRFVFSDKRESSNCCTCCSLISGKRGLEGVAGSCSFRESSVKSGKRGLLGVLCWRLLGEMRDRLLDEAIFSSYNKENCLPSYNKENGKTFRGFQDETLSSYKL